ncbi:unnamed protein product [Fraxinus pennsylvanica]|uniref:Protein kinase domain-containing protein n=1 Tax=Fraxinus pennsylvanica TaxID=56036 RepID=A0AAD1YM17_9LAMI|nr:unnamed protein product [Fraxinus pennsylvanica]
MGNPRTELVSKKCAQHHAQSVSQLSENYSKVIVSMQKTMSGNKFATGEEGQPPNRVYVCWGNAWRICLKMIVKFASILSKPRSLAVPYHSASVYYDGCFLRVENYSFFQESSSPDYDVTKKRCSDAQNVQGNNFDPLVKQLVKELTKAAPENRGYAEGRATSNSLYAYDAIFLYLSVAHGTVGVCLLAILVGYLVGATISQRLLNHQNKQKRVEFDSDIKKRSLHFKYSSSTLEKATENFNEAVKIGQGGSREIFKGTLPDGREFAIKWMFLTGKLQIQEVCNEMDIIGQAQHPNLVRFLGCCFTNDDSFLVYEFLANRSLDHILFGTPLILLYKP